MSVHRVLAAAAVLREFDLTEISAFCDERPQAIVEILDAAAPAIAPAGECRWRVVDRAEVRRAARHDGAGPLGAHHAAFVALPAPRPDERTRLQLAEETLVACRAEPSARRREIMVATAVNHLRQVLAATLPDRFPWWSVELDADRLDHELRRHADPAVAVRLQLGVAVARLAQGNVSGNPVPADELIDAVARFRDEPLLGDPRLQGLVGGFVDLATAQESPRAAPVDRLIVAVARRRAQAQVERDLGSALHALEPLLRSLGSGRAQPPAHDLFQTLRRLPDGHEHAVVYSDLLHVLPAQLRWRPTGEPVPGALVEVVAEPEVTVHLRRYARTLEADLVHSPFGSDTALIGQAAHVFRELAEERAGPDRTVVSRADEARCELLALAKASVWPPVARPAGTQEGTVNPAQAVRTLVRGALDPDEPGTVHDLVRIVAQVTGSRGALLWEVPDERGGAAGLSVLALWVDPAHGPVPPELDADPVTALAFTTRSLAVPDDVPGRRSTVLGCDVVGALPIDYVDGCRGALTLLGHRPLSGAAFDTVVELVEVLPELCGAVRERQTLALVNACETILHDGDVESRDGPVPRQQLAALLSEVCRAIAATLHAAEVSVFLEDPACPPGRYALFAHSTGAPDLDARRGPVTAEAADRTGFVAGAAVPFMEVRLLGGAHVRGFVRCLGTEGPPDHFTTSDLALIRPVAAALSRYWRTWQHRCALSEENESWRRLAAGMTSLNRLVAEVLGSSAPDEEQVRRVGDLAVQIMRDVVPQTATATAYRAHPHRSRPFVAMAHTGNGSAPVPSRLAEETVRTHRQHRLGPDGDDPGWVVCTPIGIGEHVFGVLETVGPAALPPNSAQVNAIIGDQLGLYRHLQDALGRLHEARHHLELALRTEAEAMEDLKHQLVSPLRTAVSRTESVLRGGRFDGRVEAQLRAVRGLCRRASRVAMAAGVFATLSRGQQPVSKPERIGGDDLVRLLIAAADDAQVLSDPRRGITFEVDRESVRRIGRRLVHVDTSFLQQCVGNVLDNAAKYGYENTRVHVDADVAPAQLTLAVASTGIPLRPAELPQVVARNWRGDMARSTTGEGSGLGLWIVDHLTRAMGGRLVVDARADLTTVRLLLPLT